jgi:copper chaperone CopZ
MPRHRVFLEPFYGPNRREDDMTTTATYTVTGMTCDHCARSVAAEIGALHGVSDVNVDLSTGVVTVQAGQPLDTSSVRDAVEEAGYSLEAS